MSKTTRLDDGFGTPIRLMVKGKPKGGAGSRGGHVTGYTKSGKVIYGSNSYKTRKDWDAHHADWSEADHKEAMAYHDGAHNAARREGKRALADHHAIGYHNHLAAMREKRESGAKQPMAKAVGAQGIVSIDEAVGSTCVILTPPEVVPGSVMSDDQGNVIRGIFRLGPYSCEYNSPRGKLPWVTIAGTVMAVPYNMIVKSWADAQVKCARAVEAFQGGVAAPDEGVFQNVGSKVAVKWPGVPQ